MARRLLNETAVSRESSTVIYVHPTGKEVAKMTGCEETKRKKKISAQNALRKLDLFTNCASRVKAKGRRGSLFLEGTQNGKFSSCCHGGLVR